MFSTRTKKYIAILGLIVPFYFFLFITVISPFWRGYDYFHEMISTLGSASSPFRGVVNVLGFMVLGVTIILLTLVMYDQMMTGRLTKLAAFLNISGGLGIFLIAFFPTDRSDVTYTLNGHIHDLLTAYAMLTIPAGIMLSAYSFKKALDWSRGWVIFSQVIGFLVFVTDAFVQFEVSSPFRGLVERIGAGLVLVWIFFMALKLLLKEIYDNIDPTRPRKFWYNMINH